MATVEPIWLVEARKHIGTKEIKGTKHNAKIVGWWKAIKLSGIKDDEVPWCASFLSACLEASGIRSTRSGAARSYTLWGIALAVPIVGCIVVFSREGGGGHVGFVVGKDASGRLLVLGGNQGDEVNIRAFSVNRVIGYRWPAGEKVPEFAGLPISGALGSSIES